MLGSMSLFHGTMFRKPVKEEDLRRLRNIRSAALLVSILLCCFFLLSANIYLLFLLVFLLIIGFVIPWVLSENLSSHILLQKEIADLKKSISLLSLKQPGE
jgi:hypothetical protein